MILPIKYIILYLNYKFIEGETMFEEIIKNLINLFTDYLTNYWQSIIDTLTDIRSPAYTWFFLLIMIKIYRKYFL